MEGWRKLTVHLCWVASFQKAEAENFLRTTAVQPNKTTWPAPTIPPAVWYKGCPFDFQSSTLHLVMNWYRTRSEGVANSLVSYQGIVHNVVVLHRAHVERGAHKERVAMDPVRSR